MHVNVHWGEWLFPMHINMIGFLLAYLKIGIQYVTQAKFSIFMHARMRHPPPNGLRRHCGALAGAARGGGPRCSWHHPSTIPCCWGVALASSA